MDGSKADTNKIISKRVSFLNNFVVIGQNFSTCCRKISVD